MNKPFCDGTHSKSYSQAQNLQSARRILPPSPEGRHFPK